jgi:hypothetical protein
MHEGSFGKGSPPPGINILSENRQLEIFCAILHHNWNILEEKSVTSAQKRSMLQACVDYLFIQMEKKSSIQSLEIFYELFHL